MRAGRRRCRGGGDGDGGGGDDDGLDGGGADRVASGRGGYHCGLSVLVRGRHSWPNLL